MSGVPTLRPPRRAPARYRGSRALLLAGAAVYAWVAAGLRAFTLPMDAAVALVVLVMVVVGLRRPGVVVGNGGAGAPSHRGGARPPGGAVWIGLVALLGGWELVAYLSSPRHDHPTLSSISDQVMSTHPGRAVMFALWLALGWALFARRARAAVPEGRR